MNSQLIKILIVLCLAFGLMITVEWFYADYRQKQLLSSKITPSKLADAEMPTLQLGLKPEASYNDLVNRPLFIMGRKPVPEAEATQSGEQATTAMGNISDWQLNGVYTTPKGLMALLTRTVVTTPTDKYRKVLAGANMDGWNVAEIHTDKIVLTQGATQKNLLLRPPKPKDPQEKNSAIPSNSGDGNTTLPEPTNDSTDNDNNEAQNQ
jgi:hypothetical protein